jgi:hypothetical protein
MIVSTGDSMCMIRVETAAWQHNPSVLALLAACSSSCWGQQPAAQALQVLPKVHALLVPAQVMLCMQLTSPLLLLLLLLLLQVLLGAADAA